MFSMYPWNRCRTCLCAQNLFPIFLTVEHCEKYSEVLLATTGLKVDHGDILPQVICSNCITFINESMKFRKKCEESYKLLLSRVNNKEFSDIKIETSEILKQETEKATEIDISDSLNTSDDHFQDYDDHIPLDTLQYTNSYIEKTENGRTGVQIEFESRVQDIVDQPLEIIFVNKKKRVAISTKERPKRKTRTKKEVENRKKDKVAKQKEDRVREDIECDVCHKMLTSKLSMRNHYKIHTGFDVVCEHCGKKFITRRLLLMHCRAKHGYEKTDKCSYCDYRASNAEQVKIHERLHTGERPFVCAQCGAGFHRKSSYLQHVAIHLPEKTVQCDVCPARFKSVTLMRIHKNRHRAPQYSFRCTVCDNTFSRRRNVTRHLQRIHGLAPDEQHIDRLKIG